MTITPTSRTPLALVLTLFFQATTGAQSPALREGVAALNAGEADAAIALLEQAAATDPTPRLALLHLAQAHLSAWPDGDENEWPAHAAAAIAALRRALALDARDTLARWNLAMVHGRLEQLEDGVGELRRLLAIDPSYPDAARALGTWLTLGVVEARGETDAAGTTLAARRQALDEALRFLEEARALEPASANAVMMTATALRLRAGTTADPRRAERDRAQAAAFVMQALALRRQPPSSPVPEPLDPGEPPPRLSPPAAPPPPPGR